LFSRDVAVAGRVAPCAVRVEILIADGFNQTELQAVRAALASASAVTFVIGPRRSEIYAAGAAHKQGSGVKADHHFEGMRSTMFDAVYIPSGQHAATLSNNGRAIHYVKEAFGHCKAIGAIGDGMLPASS